MVAEKERAIAVGALSKCSDSEMLESTFERFQISDYNEKISCLNECMGNPTTFFSTGDNISLDKKYYMTKLMFLDRSWEVAALIK